MKKMLATHFLLQPLIDSLFRYNELLEPLSRLGEFILQVMCPNLEFPRGPLALFKLPAALLLTYGSSR